MEQHKLEITLEQRDWERLQKLSERNGEPMESLVAKMVARELARMFNKPPDVVISPEARRIRDAFIAGKTQSKSSPNKVTSPAETEVQENVMS